MRWLDGLKSEDEPRQGPLVSLLEALSLVVLSTLCVVWGFGFSGFSIRGWGAAQTDLRDGLNDAASAQNFFSWTLLAGLALAAVGVFGVVTGLAWSVAIARRWTRRRGQAEG